MDPGLFLRGLVIGAAVAAALGPIGLLVIRRTIDRGFALGMVSGLGVATADALYGAVAAFGLTAVTELLVGADRALGIAGGAVLVALAVRGLRAALRPAPTEPARDADGRTGRRRGMPAAWASMVALTLANPATTLSFGALFAAIGAGTGGPIGAALVTAGVFAGSTAWWVILVGAVAALRARLSARVVGALNVASAVVIGAFGVVAIALGLAGS